MLKQAIIKKRSKTKLWQLWGQCGNDRVYKAGRRLYAALPGRLPFVPRNSYADPVVLRGSHIPLPGTPFLTWLYAIGVKRHTP